MVKGRPLQLMATCEEDGKSKKRYLGFRLIYNDGEPLPEGEECTLLVQINCHIGDKQVVLDERHTFRGQEVLFARSRYYECKVSQS